MNRVEYEEKLAKLKNEINELKKVKIDDEEFPQVEEKYWFVSDVEDIHWDTWTNHYIDNYRKHFLRIFQTKEECERYKEVQTAFKEESKKFKPDWEDIDQCKYYLYYNHYDRKLNIGSSNTCQHGGDYFERKKALENLITHFGEDDVKKYYLGIED